jgi:hypothetical protein
MTRRPNSKYRIPAFRGFRTFKQLQAEPEIPDIAADPSLQPEELGTIKRYLRYADTLINGVDPPVVNEPVQPISGPLARRSTDREKKIA